MRVHLTRPKGCERQYAILLHMTNQRVCHRHRKIFVKKLTLHFGATVLRGGGVRSKLDYDEFGFIIVHRQFSCFHREQCVQRAD